MQRAITLPGIDSGASFGLYQVYGHGNFIIYEIKKCYVIEVGSMVMLSFVIWILLSPKQEEI